MQTRKPLHPHLSTPRAFTEFTAESPAPPLAVTLVDYGIVVVAKLTAISPEPVTINSVLVDDEFRPVLAVGDRGILFSVLEWPRTLSPTESFSVALPIPADPVKEWNFYYPKVPERIVVSTGKRNYSFSRGERVAPPQCR